MGKLTRGRVAWIVDEMEKGERSVHGIARRAGVTKQWVHELWRRSGYGRVVPEVGRPGRPRTDVPDEERALVLAAEARFRLHPLALEAEIRRAYGRHIPHNRIWRVLKEAGLVVDTPAKQARRAWVRFERRFSNSLWQMDYTVLRPGQHLLVILDDASRLVVGYAVARRPTAQLAWDTFADAGVRYGFPREVLTDHGTQFTKDAHEAVGFFDGKLAELRADRGVRGRHVHGRVKHPQTGGKIERVIGTIKSKVRATWPDGRRQFRDVHEVVSWYNEVKPHASLDFEHAETPAEAFVRKLRPRERAAFLSRRRVGREG